MVHDEAHAESESLQIENHHTEDEELIIREVKSAVKEMVANKLSSMVQKSLDDFLRTLLFNLQRGIRPVVYEVAEQVMLDLIRKDVIGETVDIQRVNIFRQQCSR